MTRAGSASHEPRRAGRHQRRGARRAGPDPGRLRRPELAALGRGQPGAGPAAARRVAALGGAWASRRGRRSRSAGTGYEKVDLADLVGNGTLTEDAADFLRAIGPGPVQRHDRRRHRAGKTTLLRAMAAEIGPEERIVTVEKALELGLRKPTPPGTPTASSWRSGSPTPRARARSPWPRLVRRTLRMNPDRVIVGEVLGPEVIDDAQRDGPGQRRVAVDDPRPVRARGVQPHRHLRHPVAASGCRTRPPSS